LISDHFIPVEQQQPQQAYSGNYSSMITSPSDLRQIIELGEDVLLCWFEAFCGKYPNLVMDSLRNEIFKIAVFCIMALKKVVAPILEVKEAVRNEVVQACDP
jgi:hypothetical protein